jgi:hypothetical protein
MDPLFFGMQELTKVSPEQEYFAVKAPRHNATEQKMWIQSTLRDAKRRGEDWIESNFSDDETAGCSSCLPDIVIVNDCQGINTNDSLASKAQAPWQRILSKEQAEKHIENYPPDDYCCAPTAVPAMCQKQSASTSDTYLYNNNRFLTMQKVCSRLFVSFDTNIFQVLRQASAILRQYLHEQLLQDVVSRNRKFWEVR